MIGSLGAFWALWRKPAPSQVLAALGAMCVLASFMLFDATIPHPSAWTLLPVGGTTLVLVFARQGTIIARILALRPLVGIGLISYSAYLWHQPLFAFARLRSIIDPTLTLMLSLTVLSLILATLTWKFVEEPFRKQKGRAPRLLPRRTPLLGASVLALVMTIGIGVVLHILDGAPWRTSEIAMRYLASEKDLNPLHEICHQKGRTPEELNFPPDPLCIYNNNPGGSRAIIIGDSHADAFAFPVRAALKESGWNTTELTVTACPPVPGVAKGSYKFAEIYEYLLNYLRQENFDLIIVGMRLQTLWGSTFDNGEGGQEPVNTSQAIYNAEVLELPPSASLTAFASAALRKGVSDLLALGSPVIVVHAIPEAGWNIPQIAAKRAFYLGDLIPEITTNRNAYDARAKQGNAVLDAISNPNLFHVRPADIFCNDLRCINARDGYIYYYDDDHLSLAGGNLIADGIREHLPKVNKLINTSESKNITN